MSEVKGYPLFFF